ncbi:MAG: hypothetical protein ACYDBQ_10500 [Thermoplasmatota archaeon]
MTHTLRNLTRMTLLAAGTLLAVAGPLASAQLPLPPVSEQVATPVGTTAVNYDNGALSACTDANASTSTVTNLVPVPLPLPVPDAGASAHACASGQLPDAQGVVAGAASQVPVAQDGLLGAALHWIMSLF